MLKVPMALLLLLPLLLAALLPAVEPAEAIEKLQVVHVGFWHEPKNAPAAIVAVATTSAFPALINDFFNFSALPLS